MNFTSVIVQFILQGTVYVQHTIFPTQIVDIHTLQEIDSDNNNVMVEPLPNGQRQICLHERKELSLL